MIKHSRSRAFIEPLESRIAPALLINGANLLGGPNSPHTGETSVGGNSVTLVQVISGEAIVWFDGVNIEGISFGPNTNLVVTGDVHGDIVGNLLPNGRLSDTDGNPLNGEDGGILLPNNLIGLKTQPLSGEQGSIFNIITAGSISNVSINGKVSGMYAGDGVFRPESVLVKNGVVSSSVGDVDFNPVQSGFDNTFHFSPLPVIEPGAAIHDVTIHEGVQFQAISGSGNPNHINLSNFAALPGGSIYNVTISSATINVDPSVQTPPPSYELIAGDGGSGGKGGAGGSINNIVEKSSTGQVVILAGHGGDGSKGAGGPGGSVTNLDLESNSTQYTVHAGDGGKGTPGGAGGSVMSNSFANNTPAGGVVLAADFTGDGADDILIADQGTGQMVLEENNGSGTDFTPLVQHLDGGPQSLITPPAGSSLPVAAAPIFLQPGHTIPDLLVAYGGSNQLVIYQNQGTGSQGSDGPPAEPPDPLNGIFWDAKLQTTGAYATVSVGLSFSPVKMAALNGSGTEIALAENTNGHSVIHLVERVSGSDTLGEVNGTIELTAPCVGLVAAADGTLLAALSNGNIVSLSVTGNTGSPFSELSDLETVNKNVSGGISSIDIDSSGSHLLALTANGKNLQVFNEGAAANMNPGKLELAATVNLATLGARPEIAHFVAGTTYDRIALLSAQPSGAQINLYDLSSSLSNSTINGVSPETPAITTSHNLRNFAVAYSDAGGAGLAGLQTSLGQFTFDSNFANTFTDFALPFASKTVILKSGDGGDGIDIGTKLGKGGAGGNMSGINADAHDIDLTAGMGGDSQRGAGGAGGSFTNPAKIKTAGGANVAAQLLADESISIVGGDGGAPNFAGDQHASGGAGGSVSGFSITLNAGDSDLFLVLGGGSGGDGHGGAGGAGGSVTGIDATGHDGGLVVTGGKGGAALPGATAAFGNGGAGGSIENITYSLTLDKEAASQEKTHSASLDAGPGGVSTAGFGGAGGAIENVSLQMQAADETYDTDSTKPSGDAHLDSTVLVHVHTGFGGDGTKGGNGGGITNFDYTTISAQSTPQKSIITPFATLEMIAEHGGTGTTGNGGNGGSISLSKPISGVSYFDPDSDDAQNTPLVVTAGNGGDGAVKGGAGGSIAGLTAQNAKFQDGTVITSTQLVAAEIQAGSGGDGHTGDGGAGGAVTKALVGVENVTYKDPKSDPLHPTSISYGGFLDVNGGDGGTGGTGGGVAAPKARGGAGGPISQVEFGLVSTAASVPAYGHPQRLRR